ncbi:MAG: hypothetical protein JEZ11_01550 [Desulfobacterales bacterium]|nr:hypothetical protein [Desulfobacterales bacterium]
MAPFGKESLKPILVAVLAVVFVLVAYWRLGSDEKRVSAAMGETKAAAMEIPDVGMDVFTAPQTLSTPSAIAWQEARRDLFEPPANDRPAVAPAAADPAAVNGRLPAAPLPPPFVLKGTIVSGGQAIAVIDDRFVRIGDDIQGYRVEKIGRKQVWLTSSRQRIILGALENDGH